ncbi:MAG: carbohydrate ABC transporter permease [Armatimonadetes bacterium]|nr:carbohydrate ABC transporter permease [Armatimonadota bacterium]
MSIIPKVGRRTLKMRLVIFVLYLALIVGAVTMVYPFVLMLSSSITSGADVNNFSFVPTCVYNKAALFPKYAEDRYAGDLELINQTYGADFAKIEAITPPASTSKALTTDWEKFVKALPIKYKQAGFEGYAGSPSKLKRTYQAFCRERFNNDITQLNAAYVEENESFQTVTPPFERFKMREWEPDNSPKMREWMKFKESLPGSFVRPILIDPAFRAYLRNIVYSGSIKHLNANWETSYKSFNQINLSPTLPAQSGQQADWGAFVREQLPFRYMEISPRAITAYRSFLSKRYLKRITDLNKRHKAAYASFAEIALPKSLPTAGAALVDWMDFIAKAVPLADIHAINAENIYREHLKTTYGAIVNANQILGSQFQSFESATPPVYQSDWIYCSTNAGALRRDFMTRNYALVIDYVLLHGRAVFNTIVFVLAVILVHLLVNPMCAYALSRYNLPYAYKVLLFLLATMAFPAEVAMIPNFLLLKQFHLLNTYWALILPGMANGYAIFLLKGFFDSLPKELYEAGIIDGASEFTMFRKITIPMSKPIFAVIALQAFTGAYGAFMYAMLVCQDSKMWTMMVWLYQLQANAPQYVTMAALTLAALPTLLVFIFAQNVIMRGIIIPSFK